MGNNIGMISLGCDKNRVDTEAMLSILSKDGYSFVDDAIKADVIIINTCGFIEAAKQESINTISEMAKYKKNGDCSSIIVTGCMAERFRDELIKKIPEIDAIVGTGSYRDISEVVLQTLEGKKNIIKAANLDFEVSYEDRIITTPSYLAYVKIAEGCDNRCTYCVIPKIRGSYRSKSMEDILRECTELAELGVKELILIAQDTTRYGIDLYGEKMLCNLLKEIEKIDGIEWIRVLYSYPEELSRELIEIINKSIKIVPYFDIPIQHISNKILKLMGRKISKEQICNIIKTIRISIPEAVIRTSIIVGFPQETEEDFLELKEFLKEYKIDRVGVFTYSKEDGTAAAKLDLQIDEETKERRRSELMNLQEGINSEKNNQMIGKVIDVIIEGISDNNLFYGRTKADIPMVDQQIFIDRCDTEIEPGSIVKIRVTKSYTHDLAGEFCN